MEFYRANHPTARTATKPLKERGADRLLPALLNVGKPTLDTAGPLDPDEFVSSEGGTPGAAVLPGTDPASGGTVTTVVIVDEVYPTLVVVTVHGTYVPPLNVLVTYEEVTVLVG